MPTRYPAWSTCSGRSRPNTRHSAYSSRFATIVYPWHPLFGRTLRVSPFRRAQDLTCIYTEERPDLCRELPNWMFDASYCAGMTLGPPQVSIEGLDRLASVLASFGETRNCRAPFRSSPSKEKGGAENQASKSSQLALELQCPNPHPLVGQAVSGLVEALADLLLAALGAQAVARPTETGGDDEHQDHP